MPYKYLSLSLSVHPLHFKENNIFSQNRENSNSSYYSTWKTPTWKTFQKQISEKNISEIKNILETSLSLHKFKKNESEKIYNQKQIPPDGNTTL